MSVSDQGRTHVKGLSLMPIDGNTMSTRKLKMKAWSNDKTENQEKTDKG